MLTGAAVNFVAVALFVPETRYNRSSVADASVPASRSSTTFDDKSIPPGVKISMFCLRLFRLVPLANEPFVIQFGILPMRTLAKYQKSHLCRN